MHRGSGPAPRSTVATARPPAQDPGPVVFLASGRTVDPVESRCVLIARCRRVTRGRRRGRARRGRRARRSRSPLKGESASRATRHRPRPSAYGPTYTFWCGAAQWMAARRTGGARQSGPRSPVGLSRRRTHPPLAPALPSPGDSRRRSVTEVPNCRGDARLCHRGVPRRRTHRTAPRRRTSPDPIHPHIDVVDLDWALGPPHPVLVRGTHAARRSSRNERGRPPGLQPPGGRPLAVPVRTNRPSPTRTPAVSTSQYEKTTTRGPGSPPPSPFTKTSPLRHQSSRRRRERRRSRAS